MIYDTNIEWTPHKGNVDGLSYKIKHMPEGGSFLIEPGQRSQISPLAKRFGYTLRSKREKDKIRLFRLPEVKGEVI